MRRRVDPRLQRLGRWVRARVFRVPVEEEVEEELRFHLEMRIREHVARGMPESEARRVALAGFGDLDRMKADLGRIGERRDERMERQAWLADVGRDLRVALRALRRSPGFTAVAVTTLALGIGANAAVFSVVNGVLLRPLPYRDPGEVVAVWTRYVPRSGFDIARFPLSGPEYLDYRAEAAAMADVAAYTVSERALADDRQAPQRVRVGYASASLFPLLGVAPALGRWPAPEEDVPGALPVALVSHDLWSARLGADPSAVGGTVRVNEQETRVVGVMPRGFVFPTADVELWIPLRFDEANPGSRGGHWLSAVGRLAPGRTVADARAELETISARWSERFEHYAMGHFVIVEPLHRDLVGDVDRVLLLLMAAVALVLLVACANLANLLLARGEGRQRDVAVRAALGAGRWRLVRQLLVETSVLAAAGAAVGLVLAAWAVGALAGIDPTALPRMEAVRLDPTVLGFTGGLALATVLLFGLLPALQTGRGNRSGLMRGSRSTDDLRRKRFRQGLVTLEVALSLVVVLAAGLVARGLRELASVDPGLRPANLLTFRLQLPQAGYPGGAEVAAFYRRLVEDLGSLPGVAAATLTTSLPLADDPQRWDFAVEGRPAPGEGELAWNAHVNIVGPDYHGTLGIPLVAGRDLSAGDVAGSLPVAVVNATWVRTFFPGGDPLGLRIRFGSDQPWIHVVGVGGDARGAGLDAPARPEVHLAHAQVAEAGGGARSVTVALRTFLDPRALVGPVREAVSRVDRRLPLAEVRTMEDVVSSSIARPRLVANLLGAFAALALLLATVGIYGVVSYSVARRTREIGVRMALGARAGHVVRMVVREGAAPAALGVVLGLAAALPAVGLLSDFLFGLSPRDPVSFLALPALLLGVALAATWLPARRATRVDPVRALREE